VRLRIPWQVPGLPEPWIVPDVELDLKGNSVVVYLGCRQECPWTDRSAEACLTGEFSRRDGASGHLAAPNVPQSRRPALFMFGTRGQAYEGHPRESSFPSGLCRVEVLGRVRKWVRELNCHKPCRGKRMREERPPLQVTGRRVGARDVSTLKAKVSDRAPRKAYEIRSYEKAVCDPATRLHRSTRRLLDHPKHMV
jgi:hypothetical protein